MYATMLPSSSRPPDPIEYLPVPTKSARVLIAFGEHGPGGTMEHAITCASQLCQLNRIVLPSRRMCSHEFPVGPPPSCSGLELPPNVFCLWLRLPVSGSSFMQPPPVRRQSPGFGHGLIGVVTESSARAVASAQLPTTVTWFVHDRFSASQAGLSSVLMRASKVSVTELPAGIDGMSHTIVPPELPTAGAEVGAGLA